MGFIVRVLRGAQPAHRVKVRVGFTSKFGGMSLLGYTDTAGHALFESPEEGVAEVHVEGVSYGIYDYGDDGSVTLNLDMDGAEETEQ
jgi:hypothetical protein